MKYLIILLMCIVVYLSITELRERSNNLEAFINRHERILQLMNADGVKVQ